ncbi:hypothetical protein F4778DRAFT_779285 [Xylariomycetidae sp. FL2044]|nr:hypothetical protein F4778DRAFT_779285 [Xylariomycetidae sp. FL2044]
MIRHLFGRHTLSPLTSPLIGPLIHRRSARKFAYGGELDPDDLAEARKWRISFTKDSLPKGKSSFSRSSGPGGQHVNKTESKATTVWSVEELSKCLPKLLHSAVRTLRYYVRSSDSIVVQAQTTRSKSSNAEENRTKLAAELVGLYNTHVPGPTGDKTIKRIHMLEKTFNEDRLVSKKRNSDKKSYRKNRGGNE